MARESEIIKRRLAIFIGVAYLLLGFIVILQSFRGLTGFVIFEDVPQQIGWLVGVVSIIVGIIVIAVSRESGIVYIVRGEKNKEKAGKIKDTYSFFGGKDRDLE